MKSYEVRVKSCEIPGYYLYFNSVNRIIIKINKAKTCYC